MISSILDQDLYTFTVGQAIQILYPKVPVTYKFTNRRPNGKMDEEFHARLRTKIDNMQFLCLTDDEVNFLKTLPFLKQEYISWLKYYRFDPTQVKTKIVDGNLELEISGLWCETVFWEVPLLALISETWFETQEIPGLMESQYQQFLKKGKLLEGTVFADFGTRRRRSFDIQDLCVKTLKEVPGFVGTSNVYFAMKYNVKSIGTMSHQWIMGVSALESLRHANRFALRGWNEVYQGSLGIALPDTFGTDAFWEDFDPVLSRLFDGVRHDSGDPFLFAERAIKHYESLGIDPRTRTVVFSDGLNCELARKLWDAFLGKIKVSFGIGTHLTNDVFGCAALNMVIKLYTCNGIPVIKMGDGNGKGTGDKDAMAVALWTFKGKPLGI